MPSVVFDASTLVGALLKADSVPERALLLARSRDRICLSQRVAAEIREVFARPKFSKYADTARIIFMLDVIFTGAAWFESEAQVTDCRDAKDNMYLELALAASADTIVSSDSDLLALNPWRGVAIMTPGRYLQPY